MTVGAQVTGVQIQNIISRRQFHDCRKKTAGMFEEMQEYCFENGWWREIVLCRFQFNTGLSRFNG